MLEKIELENFTTFINNTTISLIPTNYKFLENENVSSSNILKGLLFVGENASGKTQIINSIKLLLDLLFSNNSIDFSIYKSLYTKKESYKLKYYFLVDNKHISYEIELSNSSIVKEKLIFDNNILIDRLDNSAVFNYNEERIYRDLSSKLLFLRRIYFDTYFYDNSILNNWINYLKNSIYINCYTKELVTYNNNNNLSIKEYLNNKGVNQINEFLNKINYKEQIKYDKLNNNEEKVISFKKDDTNEYINETLESTGNKTLINLLPPFLYSINNNSIIILDEFSSGFHNELEECLIKYFFHYSSYSQLIFASHSTNILNNTIIRPDQIYSVSFTNKGSVIKRFSEESPRESQNTEKMYLNGVFNGMPRYNKVFKD